MDRKKKKEGKEKRNEDRWGVRKCQLPWQSWTRRVCRPPQPCAAAPLSWTLAGCPAHTWRFLPRLDLIKISFQKKITFSLFFFIFAIKTYMHWKAWKKCYLWLFLFLIFRGRVWGRRKTAVASREPTMGGTFAASKSDVSSHMTCSFIATTSVAQFLSAAIHVLYTCIRMIYTRMISVHVWYRNVRIIYVCTYDIYANTCRPLAFSSSLSLPIYALYTCIRMIYARIIRVHVWYIREYLYPSCSQQQPLGPNIRIIYVYTYDIPIHGLYTCIRVNL